jgi:hypothetical protein
MYQFSRSLYRELADEVISERGEDVAIARQQFLRACESSMERLAMDRHYFAKPVKTLFRDVRHFFPMKEQLRVYRACEREMTLATEYVDSQLRTGVTFDGSPVCCHASTRRGTACQRMPLPGRRYCPSHKHLDDDFEVAAAA